MSQISLASACAVVFAAPVLFGCVAVPDRHGALTPPHEDASPASLSFPAPDPGSAPTFDTASAAPLPPAAEAARQEGLAAVRSSDWKTAIAAFQKAQGGAHCDPSLLYNLALAHDRGGQAVSAALWYRAYLAESPEGANAPNVRSQIERLTKEVETRALREFDEATRLAEVLSADSTVPGSKSLRQAAMEKIAMWAYIVGLPERADGLLARAKALPGAAAVAENIALHRSEQGLYAATFAHDIDRAKAIRASIAPEAVGGRVGGMMVRLYAERGDAAQAYAVLRGMSTIQLQNTVNVWYLYQALLDARAYDAVESIENRLLDDTSVFGPELFGWGVKFMEDAFWDGRPDVALRLAGRLRKYFEKYDLGKDLWDHRQYYLLVLAVMNDRNAFDTNLRRGNFSGSDYGREQMLLGRLALVLMLNRSDAEVKAFLDDQLERVPFMFTRRSTSEADSEADFPLAYFALRVVSGQPNVAVDKLVSFYGANPNSTTLRRALEFAVVSGRSELAFALAQKHPDSMSALRELNRLARRADASAALRARTERFGSSVCHGWRPADSAQALAAWWRIMHAKSLDPNEYGPMSSNIEQIAREKPDALPSEMAAHAAVLWMGGLAMHVEK